MKTIVLCCMAAFLWSNCLWGQAESATVATFNIRYANPGDAPDTWENRRAVVANLIRFHEFDIVGIQEGLHRQVMDLAGLLPSHDFVGVGRDDGKEEGEYSAIFYNKERFGVLQTETFWLAPDTSYPNKGWDAALPRICTWAKMEDKVAGKTFFVFNTHFDHRGVEARNQSAQLILDKIQEINPDGMPVLLTGDFNVGQETAAYQLLKSAPGMKDTFDAAGMVYANNGTTNGFDTSTSTERIIDHIFVSEAITVKKYGILTDTYHGRYPSDHFPVMAVISW